MALTDKKYEKFYKTTGTGDDKVETKNLLIAEELWDADRAIGMRDHIVNPELAPLIFQLQQIQDELDYLRTEISSNKDKTGISTVQASAITANTAKTGITSGEQRDIANNKTNVASNVTEITKLTRDKLSISTMPIAQAGVEQAVECGVVYDSKAKTYSMMFAYSETIPGQKGGKATTVTRTGSITLT